jgi:hypothetical protein
MRMVRRNWQSALPQAEAWLARRLIRVTAQPPLDFLTVVADLAARATNKNTFMHKRYLMASAVLWADAILASAVIHTPVVFPSLSCRHWLSPLS